MLVVFVALSTCDPGNVLDAVKAAKQARVRVSVVGVAAEVHICRVITTARARRRRRACPPAWAACRSGRVTRLRALLLLCALADRRAAPRLGRCGGQQGTVRQGFGLIAVI